MKRTLTLIGFIAAGATGLVAEDHKMKTEAAVAVVPQQAPEGAEAYIISPRDGDTVKKTFLVQFGLRGMGVAPAGVNIPNTGHHHLLIDDPTVDLKLPLPMSEQSRHFGGGQTEAVIELTPGKHTLQLVMGDHMHVPHTPAVASQKITITVEE